MSAGLQITGWPAHDCPISSILFGHDETSIFTLGSDGKVSILSSCATSAVSRTVLLKIIEYLMGSGI